MRNKGFTLIELIIVISIICIILGIAIPKITGITNLNERKEAEKLVDDLKYARNMAIKIGDYVNFKIENKNYKIFSKEKNFKDVDLKFLSLEKEPQFNKFTWTKRGASSYRGQGTLILYGKNKYIISVAPVTGNINLKVEKWKKDS